MTSTFVSRGRRGTTSHLPSFCVAGVVHMALGGALGLGLGARDARDARSLRNCGKECYRSCQDLDHSEKVTICATDCIVSFLRMLL